MTSVPYHKLHEYPLIPKVSFDFSPCSPGNIPVELNILASKVAGVPLPQIQLTNYEVSEGCLMRI